jgi:hypothetical protein
MARFKFTIDGVEHTVTVMASDYIHANRALRSEGMSASETTVFEYEARLAHRAGQRSGVIDKDLEFLDWADTVEDLSDVEAEAGGEGEAEATPAP